MINFDFSTLFLILFLLWAAWDVRNLLPKPPSSSKNDAGRRVEFPLIKLLNNLEQVLLILTFAFLFAFTLAYAIPNAPSQFLEEGAHQFLGKTFTVAGVFQLFILVTLLIFWFYFMRGKPAFRSRVEMVKWELRKDRYSLVGVFLLIGMSFLREWTCCQSTSIDRHHKGNRKTCQPLPAGKIRT